ncbi:MAG: DNA ligase D [Candidatus Binatia bacterium]
MPQSVLSGLTVEELRDGIRRDRELAAAASAAGAPRAALPARALAPMLAESAAAPFSGRDWLFELKYDGIRLLVLRRAGAPPQLRARSGRDVTAQFPEIAAAAAHLPCDAFAVDGELIALDERGAGSFTLLQSRLGLTNAWDVERATATVPVQVFAFDLLAVAGHDVRGLPLTARQALLRRLAPARGVIRYADHVVEAGTAFFDAAAAHDVEGIVAKRADSPYRSGRRSRDWLKIKRPRSVDLAVVGYVPGKGSRAPLGALMLGWWRDGALVHAGNVGSGLGEASARTLLAALTPTRRATPAFAVGAAPLPKGAIFVEPRLVVEVRHAEVTERGVLRQPVLVRVRDDKTVHDAEHLSDGIPAAAAPAPADGPRFTPSNLGKVFWPTDGYTKGDLLAYYDAIWPYLGPYLRDRPVVLTRYPDGIEGKSFFQKNAPDFVPEWVPTCRIADTEYFLCNEREALRYVINLGCIPLHVWSARRGSIERPDWSILDLDPKGAPRRDVVAVARRIHALLAPLEAPHFVKTSGQEGLHVLIPLGGALTHDQSKALAEVLARLVVADLPDVATIARPLGDRGGKVYVDFLQNGFGKTVAAPFSVRPRPGAPVSTPLEWREVTARLDPTRHTIATVPPRVARRGDPMCALLESRIDVAAVLAALQARLERAGDG